MLVFPEGRKGTEKLYKDRYRLRRFGRGGFVEAAMRAGAPIVPVAVVGAEEAVPVFAQLGAAAAAHRPALLPDHADVPAPRAARHARLPAREVPDPLPAAGAHRRPGRASRGRTGRSCRTIAHDVRARDPGGAPRHGRQARAACGSGDARRRILITGLSTYWGGRLAQALEQDPEVETIIGVDTRGPPQVELERTEFVRVADQHALIRRIVQAAEIDTVVDTRLVVDSIVTAPRLAHENNVIGTMNILAACGGPDSPVRKLVFKSSRALLRRRAGRPGVLHRGHAPRRTRRGRRSSATSSRPRRAVARLRRAQPGRRRSRSCASPTRSGPALRTSHTRAARPAGGPDHPRLRPALPVHPRGRHRRLPRCTRCATTSTASTTAPPTACSRSRRSLDLLGKPLAPVLPPWGTGAGRRRAAPRRASACRPRCCASCASAAGSTTGGSRRRASATRYTTRETVLDAARAPAARAAAARARPSATATSARSRSSCASAPASGATGAAARRSARAARRRAARGAGRKPPRRARPSAGTARRPAGRRPARAPALAARRGPRRPGGPRARPRGTARRPQAPSNGCCAPGASRAPKQVRACRATAAVQSLHWTPLRSARKLRPHALALAPPRRVLVVVLLGSLRRGGLRLRPRPARHRSPRASPSAASTSAG